MHLNIFILIRYQKLCLLTVLYTRWFALYSSIWSFHIRGSGSYKQLLLKSGWPQACTTVSDVIGSDMKNQMRSEVHPLTRRCIAIRATFLGNWNLQNDDIISSTLQTTGGTSSSARWSLNWWITIKSDLSRNLVPLWSQCLRVSKAWNTPTIGEICRVTTASHLHCRHLGPLIICQMDLNWWPIMESRLSTNLVILWSQCFMSF